MIKLQCTSFTRIIQTLFMSAVSRLKKGGTWRRVVSGTSLKYWRNGLLKERTGHRAKDARSEEEVGNLCGNENFAASLLDKNEADILAGKTCV